MGSETFIMVAFMCKENKTPLSLASAICASKKASNAFLLMSVESIISPSRTGTASFKIEVPFALTSCIFTLPAFVMVTDFSLDAKSPEPMVET